MSDRRQLLAQVAAWLLARYPDRRLRVAVDGVDGAGKTTFADELAAELGGQRPVIRASVDGFHRPAAQRHYRGRDSPDGFYLDSYDYPGLLAELLSPLAPDGNGRFRSELFDHRLDKPIASQVKLAAPNAVLLFDGIFLHRPELAGCWDLSIFLAVEFSVSVARCAARDASFDGADPAAPANRRYVEGQRRYLAEARPADRADLVIDNNDLDRPVLLRDAGGG